MELCFPYSSCHPELILQPVFGVCHCVDVALGAVTPNCVTIFKMEFDIIVTKKFSSLLGKELPNPF